MNLLFVADPLETFKTYKDTTFAMMRAAAARGHVLSACEPKDLRVGARRPGHAAARSDHRPDRAEQRRLVRRDRRRRRRWRSPTPTRC